MPDQFEVPEGKCIPPIGNNELYRFVYTFYLQQDTLSWSRTQILFAVEAAVLATAFSQRTLIAVSALLFGSILVFLIWRLIQRDWQNRGQYLKFLDEFHKTWGIRMTIDAKGYWYRGSTITQFIIWWLIAFNLGCATGFLWRWYCTYRVETH